MKMCDEQLLNTCIKKRDSRLDFAKGILIFLVVLGHSFFYIDNYHDIIVYKLIYSFHMPSFMLLSGYFFYNSNNKPLKEVIISKVKTIGVPLISFSTLIWVLMQIKNIIVKNEVPTDVFSLLLNLVDFVLTSKVMWFLVSLFINCLLVSILSRVPKGYIGYIFVIIGSLFIPVDHSYIYSGYLFMFPFFLAGYYIKKNKISLFHYVGNFKFILLLTLVSIIGIYFFNRETYIYYTGMYILTENPCHSLLVNIHRFIVATSMCALFFTYIGYLDLTNIKRCQLVLELGKCSLGIYGFQQIIIAIIMRCIDITGYDFPDSYFMVIINSICVISISYALSKMCTRNNILSLLFLGRKNCI